MSEYTPTTENVRQTFAYVQAGLDDDDGYPFVTHIHVETFDRWLAEVERAAAEKAWTEGTHSAEQFYQSHIPAYGKTPLPMPVNPYRRNEGENE